MSTKGLDVLAQVVMFSGIGSCFAFIVISVAFFAIQTGEQVRRGKLGNASSRVIMLIAYLLAIGAYFANAIILRELFAGNIPVFGVLIPIVMGAVLFLAWLVRPPAMTS